MSLPLDSYMNYLEWVSGLSPVLFTQFALCAAVYTHPSSQCLRGVTSTPDRGGAQPVQELGLEKFGVYFKVCGRAVFENTCGRLNHEKLISSDSTTRVANKRIRCVQKEFKTQNTNNSLRAAAAGLNLVGTEASISSAWCFCSSRRLPAGLKYIFGRIYLLLSLLRYYYWADFIARV